MVANHDVGDIQGLPPGIQHMLADKLREFDFAFTISDCLQADMPITFASSRFYEVTGYPPSEVIGKNCRFLQGSGTEKRKVMEIRDAIREERCCQVCLLNYKKDGTPFWNQFYLSPIRDDQGKVTHYVGIQSDVTQMIAELRHVHSLPEKEIAEAFAAAAGCQDASPAGQSLGPPTPPRAAAVAPEDRVAAAAAAAAAASRSASRMLQQQEAAGSSNAAAASTATASQSYSDTDVDSEGGELPDVASLEQQGAQQILGVVAQGHPHSCWLLPTSLVQPLLRIQQSFVLADPRLPDCPIVHVSQQFLDFTGYSREEVVGRNCRFLQGPGTDREEVARLSAALKANPPTPITVTLLNYTKQGRPFWNCLHVAAVRDADGAVEFFIGVQLDVTAADEAGAGAAAGQALGTGAAGPAPYKLAHKMAHYGVTGAVRVACRSLSGCHGGLRRSIDNQGLPRWSSGRSATGSLDLGPRHDSSPAVVQEQQQGSVLGAGAERRMRHSASGPAAVQQGQLRGGLDSLDEGVDGGS